MKKSILIIGAFLLVGLAIWYFAKSKSSQEDEPKDTQGNSGESSTGTDPPATTASNGATGGTPNTASPNEEDPKKSILPKQFKSKWSIFKMTDKAAGLTANFKSLGSSYDSIRDTIGKIRNKPPEEQVKFSGMHPRKKQICQRTPAVEPQFFNEDPLIFQS